MTTAGKALLEMQFMGEDICEAIRVGKMAIEKYGVPHQVDKAIEELGELTHVLWEYYKERPNFAMTVEAEDIEKIRDEIADVWFTSIQMATIVGWDKCVERLKFKVERLEKRMSEG